MRTGMSKLDHECGFKGTSIQQPTSVPSTVHKEHRGRLGGRPLQYDGFGAAEYPKLVMLELNVRLTSLGLPQGIVKGWYFVA